MQDINLIPEELKKQKKTELRLKSFFKLSVVLLILSSIVSIGLFTYKTILNKSLSDMNANISAEEQKISSLKAMESKMTLLGDKLTFVQEVLDSRLLYSRLLEELGEISPSGVYLTDVSISMSDKVVVGGITSSYAMLSDLVKNISDNAALDDSIFDYSEVTSVNLKEEVNRIEFSMNIFLKKGALKDGSKDE